MFSTAFQFSLSDPRGSVATFAPIDSVTTSDSYTITRAYSDTTVSDVAGEFPQLAFKRNNGTPTIHSQFFYRQLYPRSTARSIYGIDSIISKTNIKISPTVGVIDASNRFVFMGIPLHLLNGTNKHGTQALPSFLNKVFGDIFQRR